MGGLEGSGNAARDLMSRIIALTASSRSPNVSFGDLARQQPRVEIITFVTASVVAETRVRGAL